MAETLEKKQERLAKARAAKEAKKLAAATQASQLRPDEANQALMDRIAKLEAALASGQVVPKEGLTKRRPGSYTVAGHDRDGAPVYIKVRWTRQDIEDMYPMIEFIPPRDMRVSPHGISYDLRAGVEKLVPSIVKSIVMQNLAEEKRMNDILNTPIGLEEISRMDSIAKRQPGIPVPSRVTIIGHGLDLGPAGDEVGMTEGGPEKK